MESAWGWAEPIREKHFAAPLVGLYPITRSNRQAYWELHDKALREHFPEEVFFDFWTPRDEKEKADKGRLESSMSADRLEDFWVVRDGERVIMMACGHQLDGRVYRMWHSHVHPEYRKKGLYRDYIARLLPYTKELGFRAVTSEHAPCNNPILIAKLRAGFRVVSMDVNAAVGLSLCLRYFHDPAELAGYEYRCGYATINKDLLARGAGAADKLIRQFKDHEAGE